jgi:ABC-type multidrug transport system fused ATPase/permease subunit/aminoglycoside phosphotransferase (APT) family kinase protein
MNRGRRLLAPFLLHQSRTLVVAAVAAVASVVADLASPFPLKIAVDLLVARRPGQEFGAQDVATIGLVALLVVGIAALDAVASYQVDVRLRRAGERIVDELRVATYAHLQRLSLAFHERRSTGDLVTRVTSDVGAVGDFFSESLGTLTVSALVLIGMLVIGVAIDPILAAAAFVVSPILAVVTARSRVRLTRAARGQRAHDGQIATLATEALSAVRVIKAFGSEDYEHARLRRVSRNRREAGLETVRLEGRYAALIDVLGAVSTTLVLVVGIARVIAGALSPGDLIVMASYSRRIYRPLRDIARQAGRISRSLARADRVGDLLAEDDILPERPDAHDGSRARGEVRLHGVVFGYDPNAPILEAVSISIPAGQRVALMGASGTGKSTLAALIARFYDPDTGAVLIDGRDARDCSLGWLRRQVGLVLADTTLFSGTVAENIAYGWATSPAAIAAAAAAAGAADFIDRLPEGYATPLGARGLGLSSGQRQRIGIARTLLRDPAILVLDEPTSGLDAESQAAVLAGLGALAAGRTTILITHSPEVARTMDRLLILEAGRIVRDGPPAEVLAANGPEPGRPAAALGRIPLEVPDDPALPQLGALLDGPSASAILARTLGLPEGAVQAAGKYLRYKPGTSLLAHYDVQAPAGRLEATIMVAPGRDLAGRALRPETIALCRDQAAGSGGGRAVAFDPASGALVQWLPVDLWLPALSHSPARLRASLRAAGVGIDADGPPPARLAYHPRRRAVLRLDDHVVKIHASAAELDAAANSLRAAASLPGIASMGLEAVDEELLLTVQPWIEGHARPDDRAAAEAAGELLARLHAAPLLPPGLPVLLPDAQLAAAGATARLATLLVPRLGPRLAQLMRALEAGKPDAGSPVVSHGDFDASQLVATAGGLSLVDLDTLCLAPAAFDAGNYIATAAARRASEPGAGAHILELFLRGYGRRPPGLAWYASAAILRRTTFPFRRFRRDWTRGVEELVGLAEAAIA